MWIMSLMGIPISLLFWYATKIGYIGFGNLWAVRFMGFATSMLTFSNNDLFISWGNYNFKNFNNFITSFNYNDLTVIMIFIIN